MEKGSKAPKKTPIVKEYKGKKKFTIIKNTQFLKKDSEVFITYSVYKIFKLKKLVK